MKIRTKLVTAFLVMGLLPAFTVAWFTWLATGAVVDEQGSLYEEAAFHTMDKIGSVSENPFEGGANDVPISAMSRGIEIDLRELVGERDLPSPHVPQRNILM